MKKIRHWQIFGLAAALGVCCLGGCAGRGQETAGEKVVETSQPASEAGQEAAAAEQKESGAAILVVSFGTSYNDNRDLTIGAIENAIAQACPQYEVRRAFTSQIIIDKLKSRDGLVIDNVEEALDRAAADGIRELIVQPTHLMDGYEYTDLAQALTDRLDQFDRILLGAPLLSGEADFEALIGAITAHTQAYDDGRTAICFMGHGTEADSNGVYALLQQKLTEEGYENYYVGIVEAEPALEDVVAALAAKGSYEKVVLEPLMVVAGDHANNDMAGEEEDSWKTVLEAQGYEVTCLLEGLGQLEAVQDLYVEHVQAAIASGEAFQGLDSAQKDAQTGSLADGVYAIQVESSSSMFKVVDARLTVQGGQMEAVLTLSGTGYGKLYLGTAEEAAGAPEEECVGFAEDAEGAYTYKIPVAALDEPIACAAFSTKKQEWYDRELTFLSATASPAASSVADGVYSVEVVFEGGSGKAAVLSPALLTVEGGSMTARIEWNSANYDYMLVDGEKYLPVNTEGNSVFEIPVAALDEPLAVTGDTVAMSTPHEIDYTLTFLSDAMTAAE